MATGWRPRLGKHRPCICIGCLPSPCTSLIRWGLVLCHPCTRARGHPVMHWRTMTQRDRHCQPLAARLPWLRRQLCPAPRAPGAAAPFSWWSVPVTGPSWPLGPAVVSALSLLSCEGMMQQAHICRCVCPHVLGPTGHSHSHTALDLRSAGPARAQNVEVWALGHTHSTPA